jgi:asparagine synthase (glutamine-hydrolysing)
MKRLLGQRGSLGLSRSIDWASRFCRVPAKVRNYGQLLPLSLGDYYYSRTATPLNLFNRERSRLYSDAMNEMTRSSVRTEPTSRYNGAVNGRDDLARMLYVDTKTWLPDDLLVKADKITMANSLELRVPLLDHKVLEFAASLPSSLKVHGLTTKHALKRVTRDRVPPPIRRGPKRGFVVPLASWLRQDSGRYLKDVLLDPSSLQRGYFKPSAVRELVDSHLAEGCHALEVFALLTLELWHRAFLTDATARS